MAHFKPPCKANENVNISRLFVFSVSMTQLAHPQLDTLAPQLPWLFLILAYVTLGLNGNVVNTDLMSV